MEGIKCQLKEYMVDSKTEFANKIEIPLQTYVKRENKISNPTLKVALQIAKKLNKK